MFDGESVCVCVCVCESAVAVYELINLNFSNMQKVL